MANSYVEIPVTGVDSYTFPFPYIEQSHINVYAGGVLQTQGVHYTFTDSNTIEFSVGNVPTDTNTVILIQRVTDASGRLVTYSNTGLDADDLNLGSKQNFFLAQEAKDVAALNITKGVDGLTSVNGRLTNVTDPIDAQDAATKAYVASQLTQSATGGVYIQATAPSGASEGDLWVDTDTGVMSVWTSTGWANGGTVESTTYNFTGSDLTVLGPYHIISGNQVASANINQLFVNGILLKECTTALDFTTGDWDRSTTLVTFENALAIDDEITITTTTRMSTQLSDAILDVSSRLDTLLALSAGSPAAGITLKESYLATAGQTVFNLVNSYALGTNNISVYVNGVRQSAFTETSTTSITFTNPLSLTDEVLFLINEFNASVFEQVILDQTEDARDASIAAQGLAEDAKDDAITAKDVIVNNDYLIHKLGTVQLEANSSLRLKGGIAENYIYAQQQTSSTTFNTNVVASYTYNSLSMRQPVTFKQELILTSPDGLVTKELKINNAGQLVFDGTVIS